MENLPTTPTNMIINDTKNTPKAEQIAVLTEAKEIILYSIDKKKSFMTFLIQCYLIHHYIVHRKFLLGYLFRHTTVKDCLQTMANVCLKLTCVQKK